MKIRRSDIGDKRWHIACITNSGTEYKKFSNWIKNNIPECKMSTVVHTYSTHTSNRKTIWEVDVRGGETQQLMLLWIQWGYTD
jgi:hypothetical protein